MAKKSSLKVSLFALIACGLAVLAVFMFLLPMLKFEYETILGTVKGDASGFELAFGKDDSKIIVAALFSFILLILGIAALAGRLFAKKNAKLFGLVAACLFVVAGLLVFLTKADFVKVNEIGDSAKKYYSLGVGAFLVAIPAIGAGVLTALDSK